jgi:hypothetical protein
MTRYPGQQSMPLEIKLACVGFIVFLCVVFSIAIYGSNKVSESERERVMESKEAKWEYCILEKELKYPTAENNTINRLCELEEIGSRLNSA